MNDNFADLRKHEAQIMEHPDGGGYIARCKCGMTSVRDWNEATVRGSLITNGHHTTKMSYRKFAL